MSNATLSVEVSGAVALISVNNPPVNTINADVRRELALAFHRVRERSDVRAVGLLCEGSTFFSGADIGEFAGPPKEEEYRDLFDVIEQMPVPVVAGMHGTVMGGGLEIALACHYRIAAPGTRFGFPEVTLGIFPGAGGTQRMPRLIGVEKTLDMLLSARPIDVATAMALGFIDAEISGDPRQSTAHYAQLLLERQAGPRRTCDRVVDASTAAPAVLERAIAEAHRLYPHRSAALRAIDVVSAAARLSFRDGLAYETNQVNQAKATRESQALVHLFFAERETRKIPQLAATPVRPIERIGVIGAGTMGRGIAVCFANAGIPVTLLDTHQAALERGLSEVAKVYEAMRARGRIDGAEQIRRRGLIQGSLHYSDLAGIDLAIEAAFENFQIKREIFASLDAVVKPGAILATNTSTLDIEALGATTKRPQDVIGMHFFSPAHIMPLLEVVRTPATSAQVIRTVLDLAKPLKKTPVLARVCYGFIGNRMMEGYAREAERMVLEGATPRQVDGALERWGMAMGILAVFDMAGIDVGVNVHNANADRYPPDPTYYQADYALHAAGRLGQKNGKGYYKYLPGERTRHDDPDALKILRDAASRLKVEQRAHTDSEIIERCLYPMINEGMRILEEGVAMRVGDIDVVWAAGYGFPRYRGGPMFYADTLGLKTVYEGMMRYRDLFGPMHWEPAPLLVRLAVAGSTLKEWDRQQRSDPDPRS